MLDMIDIANPLGFSVGRNWDLMGDPTEVVSAMSQLAVMVKLGEDDTQFNSQLQEWMESSQYIKDLLDQSISFLGTKAAPIHEDFIDPKDRCWSTLPADSVLNILRIFSKPDHDMREIATFILETSENTRRKSGVTPVEVIRYMAGLLGQSNRLMLPTDASAVAGLWIAHEEQSVTIRMRNVDLSTILRRLYFLIGVEVELELVDPYVEEDLASDTSVFLIPAFGQKVGSDVDLRLPKELQGTGRLTSDEAALASVATKGAERIVALVPMSTLLRGGRSRQFRKWLIESAGLTSVITMAPGLLNKTAIGTAILVLDPTSSAPVDEKEVLLFHGDTDNYLQEGQSGGKCLVGWEKLLKETMNPLPKYEDCLIPQSKLADNEYVLQPSRYGAKDESGLTDVLRGLQTTTLGAAVDIISPLSVKATKDEEEMEFFEVRIGDFDPDGTVSQGSKSVRLGPAELNRLDKQILRSSDILIGTKGSVGKCAIASIKGAHRMVAGQTMVILRLKDWGLVNDHNVLYRYLVLPQVQKYLHSLAGGSAISFLKKKDLDNLPVPVLSAAQEGKIYETHMQIAQLLDEAKSFYDQATRLSREAFSNISDAE